MNISFKNKFIKVIKNLIQRYNHESYWRMREFVVNTNSKSSFILRIFYLYRIKKMDAFNNASMGSYLGKGATFLSPPILPHGLNGIIVHPRAKVGRNCTIHQQVTIGAANKGEAPTIGNNCYIGAGAKVIGEIVVGNNVIIGTNAVVTRNMPDNCTCVGVPARIISMTDR